MSIKLEDESAKQLHAQYIFTRNETLEESESFDSINNSSKSSGH